MQMEETVINHPWAWTCSLHQAVLRFKKRTMTGVAGWWGGQICFQSRINNRRLLEEGLATVRDDRERQKLWSPRIHQENNHGCVGAILATLKRAGPRVNFVHYSLENNVLNVWAVQRLSQNRALFHDSGGANERFSISTQLLALIQTGSQSANILTTNGVKFLPTRLSLVF